MSSSFIVEEWRDLWHKKGDFYITAFAYVFSTTNVFNLPSMITNFGGAAFIIAYVVCLLAACLTIIMLELAIGQLSARAPPKALHSACPLFKGVGISLVVYSLFLLSFYAVRVVYLLEYLTHMFLDVYKDPPWFSCPEVTTTPCTPLRLLNQTRVDDDSTLSINFFHNETILGKSLNISETGGLLWMLIAGLGIVWLCIFLALFLGVRWLGKACYFTFFLPLFLLFALMVKALSATGSDTVISYVIMEVDWDKLLDKTTWAKAFYQSLYATGLCLGSYITLGSYNKRSNNLVGDSFLVVFLHFIFTVVQTITTMALYGHWTALQQVVDFVPSTIHEGFNWSVVHLLAIVGQFRMPHLWTAFLLFMLIFMFLNTMYVLTLNICSSVEDAIGDVASRCLPRFGITFAICVFGFLAGLGYTTQAGSYAIELMERYLHLLCPWVILTFELMAIGWFYCGHLLSRDVRQMVGRSYCWILGYMFLDWVYLLPAVPVYLLVTLLGDYNVYQALAGYREEIADIHWAEPIGWMLAVLPLLPIPAYMIYVVSRTCLRGPGDTRWEKFKYTLISPLRYEVVKPTSPPRYSVTAPGYVLLPQAPLAEAEHYNENVAAAAYGERLVLSH